MSELKAFNSDRIYWAVEQVERVAGDVDELHLDDNQFYVKSEADKAIAEKDAEIAKLKSRIAPKQSDKSLQERLNEVCEKHGVSTLQDLDWAFCESEKRHTNDCIESIKAIARQKYKRCLAMADKCVDLCHKAKDLYRWAEDENLEHHYNHKIEFFARWHKRWLAIAEKFKPNNKPPSRAKEKK